MQSRLAEGRCFRAVTHVASCYCTGTLTFDLFGIRKYCISFGGLYLLLRVLYLIVTLADRLEGRGDYVNETEPKLHKQNKNTC